ncbi:Protein F27E5.8, partial [Aphelenchoides avenae]
MLQALLFAMECTFYALQFVVGGYFVVRIRRVSLVHVNLRILLCNFVFHYTLFGVGRIGETLTRNALDDDALPLRNSLCLLWRLVHESAMPFSALFFLWIALERLMATLFIKTYEKKGKTVGVGIVVVVYVASFAGSLVAIIYDTSVTHTFDIYVTKSSCQMASMHPAIFPVSWVACGLGYVLAVAILIVLYRYNKKKRIQARAVSLSGRYQYAENVAMLRVLVPAVLGYGCIHFLGLILFMPQLVSAWLDADDRQYDRIVHVLYLLVPVSSFATTLTLLVIYRPLKSVLKTDLHSCLRRPQLATFPLNKKGPTRTAEAAADFHFQQLKDSWK